MSLFHLCARLAHLEVRALATRAGPSRLWVVYEGEPVPADCRAQDRIILVMYDDPPSQEPAS